MEVLIWENLKERTPESCTDITRFSSQWSRVDKQTHTIPKRYVAMTVKKRESLTLRTTYSRYF